MSERMRWFYVNFDSNWVTCRNYGCNRTFRKKDVLRKNKCPNCKMDNRLCIETKKASGIGRLDP